MITISDNLSIKIDVTKFNLDTNNELYDEIEIYKGRVWLRNSWNLTEPTELLFVKNVKKLKKSVLLTGIYKDGLCIGFSKKEFDL